MDFIFFIALGVLGATMVAFVFYHCLTPLNHQKTITIKTKHPQ
jgi:hypothetical protein